MTETPQPIREPAPPGSCVFLHDSLGEEQPAGSGSILFSEPDSIITCATGTDLAAAFAEVERALEDGLHVAGGFAYELGYHLEPKLRPLAPAAGPDAPPLFRLGAFRRMERLSPAAADDLVAGRGRDAATTPVRVSYSETAGSYAAKIARLQEYILAGDIYQANFTFPATFPWDNGVWPLYARLAPHQRVAFAAVVDLPGQRVASLSPELFFRKRGRMVESRPMKGTMRRGATPDEDERLREALRNDPKNRAENLMIVDLIRNDLGRMAEIGSVSVDAPFHIETYATLHQMVTTVRAEIDAATPLADIFRHIFPCGSVTGAPKIRAMEIIAELEDAPRGIYTGAIGYVTPERDMCFSVPIRTVALDGGGTARLGIGSGVVADSDADAEFAECLLKARFLTRALGGEDT